MKRKRAIENIPMEPGNGLWSWFVKTKTTDFSRKRAKFTGTHEKKEIQNKLRREKEFQKISIYRLQKTNNKTPTTQKITNCPTKWQRIVEEYQKTLGKK